MVITLDTSPLTRSNVKKDLELRYSCSIVPWTVSDTMESTTEMKSVGDEPDHERADKRPCLDLRFPPEEDMGEQYHEHSPEENIEQRWLNLYLKVNLMDLTNSAFKSPREYIMMNQFK